MPKLFENEQIENGKLHFTENFDVRAVISENGKVAELKRIEEAKEKRLILKPKIAAIHEGRTRNNTIYLEEKLRGSMVTPEGPSGMYSFLYPYNKPMLKNHDSFSEPTGRIMNVQYVKGAEGVGYIMIIPHITDPDTIEKVLDGRYLTVSIGATANSAVCNVCGTDIITEGWCEHERGEVYDGTKCGWIIGDLWFDECSWVNIPSDTKARVIDSSDLDVYAEVNDENYDLTNGLNITSSVAEELGLVAIVTEEYEGTAEETDERTNKIPNADTAEDTAQETDATTNQQSEEEPQRSKEEAEADARGEASEFDKTEESSSAPEDNKETTKTEEEPEGEQMSHEEGNAPDSEKIDGLNERIAALENEVEALTEKLEIQRKEYANLSHKFSDFIKEAIKESQKNVEIEESSTEVLEELGIDALMIEYRRVSEVTKRKISDLSKYKVSNEYSQTANTSEQDSPKDPTKVEIYSNLLRGKRK